MAIGDVLQTTDAAVWATEFGELFGVTAKPFDKNSIMADDDAWGLMLSWFANAIEVGRSAGIVAGRAAEAHERDGFNWSTAGKVDG